MTIEILAGFELAIRSLELIASSDNTVNNVQRLYINELGNKCSALAWKFLLVQQTQSI